MELGLVIFGQVIVFLAVSLGTMMAATPPRRNHPAARSVPGGDTAPDGNTPYDPWRGE